MSAANKTDQAKLQEEIDKDIEKSISFSHYGGKASGFEDSSGIVREQAAALFLAGKDKEANLLRDLSVKLDDMGKKVREQQKEYKK